jgi:hypothetical protein
LHYFHILHSINHIYFLCMISIKHYKSLKKPQKHVLKKTWKHLKYMKPKNDWIKCHWTSYKIQSSSKYTRHSSMAQNTLTTRSFMHGWTIWHAIVLYKMDNWQNEFIMLGTNYWYWKIVKHLHASLNWKYCPTKCDMLFHARVEKLMQQRLLSSHHLYGNIKEYVIRYEIQQCGSFHAHIIWWVVEIDIENITNKIVAFIPITFDEKHEFIQPIYWIWNTFYKIVMKNSSPHMWK